MKINIHPVFEYNKLSEEEIVDIVDQFNSQLTIPNLSLRELTGYEFIPESKGDGVNYKSLKSSIFLTLYCSVSDRGNVVLDASCVSPKHEKVLTTQFVQKNYIQSLDDLNSKVLQWLNKNSQRLIGHK